MEQFKRMQVIMLPHTNGIGKFLQTETSKILLNKTNNKLIKNYVGLYNEGLTFQPQHLYIIENRLIKENEYFLDHVNNKVFKWNMGQGIHKNKSVYCNVIIATTDTSLLLDFNKESDGGIILFPQPSQQFIEKYIESYNKGEIIKDVLVEYDSYNKNMLPEISRNINIMEYYPKVNSKDNTVTIKKLKHSWNRKEVIELLNKRDKHLKESNFPNKLRIDTWIKENL